MAFGDVGGAVTELVITCKTPASGDVNIAKGDAVKLTAAYTVDNTANDEDAVFGQALAAATENGAPLPVKVRGICIFGYVGAAPAVNGVAGVLASATDGKVKAPASGNGIGVNVKVDQAAAEVHVLL
jgi:exopolyphosphatase/pppGpp-phosphohydrolase